jgi:hypothetical protein
VGCNQCTHIQFQATGWLQAPVGRPGEEQNQIRMVAAQIIVLSTQGYGAWWHRTTYNHIGMVAEHISIN